MVAVDCDGNLGGPYGSGMTLSDTTTELVHDDSVLYQVKTPDYNAMGLPDLAPFSGKFIQNQLTTLPGNGVRVRTAQGFAFGSELPESCSFYREYRLGDEDEWLAKLQEIRALANVHIEDMCRFDSSNAALEAPNCFSHFQMDDGSLDGSVTCKDLNGGNESRCSPAPSDDQTLEPTAAPVTPTTAPAAPTEAPEEPTPAPQEPTPAPTTAPESLQTSSPASERITDDESKSRGPLTRVVSWIAMPVTLVALGITGF
mmetsp:Transcript_3114/g.3479  ORF Transcript_3114/g.3479 Transcript_3114/m.3479 type:complete len:257 (-) Transcript_3114:71-841(-)|eukprot:CAMPEP_0197845338 /NCGR_PEP_ID=MMETSP1438-20131217/2284_1 /TAXON_ID=1461541 /ORGANISM="Pterosperma sp., Strain CCMP1384" /LENGTH=256 /DNA_ID=CAMNT_0043456595 /DNA_START=46 /DNA_END=816 /DNA_ORIENTATION=+